MTAILLGYELGTGYGHAAQLLPLALELRRRGHDVNFVVNDLARAEVLLGPHGFQAYQSPLWLVKVGGLPPASNYTDIMMHAGFLDPVGLLAIAKAWRNLVELLKPSLLVLDHSPAALFATAGLGLPRARLGTGFTCPPLATPMPQFAWWIAHRVPHLERSEREVLAVVNRVRGELKQPPVTRVADLLCAEQDFVCAFAETDHYPARTQSKHWGPIFDTGDGAHADWPAGEAPRVFAYVRSEYPFVKDLARGLDRAGCSAILHVPGYASAAAAELTSPRVVFSAAAVRMEDMCRECALAICHGGSSTVSAMLLAGKPLLLLPSNSEQYMMARRLETLGAAATVPYGKVAPDFSGLIRRMVGDARAAAAARAFAGAHADYSVRDTVAGIAERCEAMLGGTPS